MARDTISVRGEHQPTIIIQGSAQHAVVPLNEWPDSSEEKLKVMLVAGYSAAEARLLGELEQVWFVFEAWMSVGERGQAPTIMPSEHPQKKEALVIASLRPATQDEQASVFEIVRSQDGGLAELRTLIPGKEVLDSFRSPLLRAFAFGFGSARGM